MLSRNEIRNNNSIVLCCAFCVKNFHLHTSATERESASRRHREIIEMEARETCATAKKKRTMEKTVEKKLPLAC